MARKLSQPSRILLLLLSLSAMLAVASLGRSASLQATTEPASANSLHGPVLGNRTPDFDEFLGIRYAKPPVGPLRWQPPQPSDGPIGKANAFGPHCAQNASPFGQESTSEDCLFLNVFTPRGAAASPQLLPVMVWIHGGNLMEGESDDFDPVRLVFRGVVVVTINYRLGALGFFALPALDAEGHPAVNYGLLDQQAALKWVKDNIEGFGGDPRNVTLFGESAGAQNVLSNIASPGAHDLFARAIEQSGAYSLILPTLAQAEAQGAAFATQAGCADQTAACLRQLPIETILANQGQGFSSTILDGTVLPQSIDVALKTGRFNRVPVMVGSNHDEGRLFIAEQFDLAGAPLTPAGYDAFVRQDFPAIADLVLSQYPTTGIPGPDLALAAIETDALFSCNTLHAGVLASQYVPAFEYEFSDEEAPELFLPPVSIPYGATHASEIQFLFDRFAQAGKGAQLSALTPLEDALADSMVRYWTNFAKDGNPNDPSLPEWDALDAREQLVESLAPRVQPISSFSTHHKCAFWNPIIQTQPLPL
jgi:para-nitrobenzyl esterase